MYGIVHFVVKGLPCLISINDVFSYAAFHLGRHYMYLPWYLCTHTQNEFVESAHTIRFHSLVAYNGMDCVPFGKLMHKFKVFESTGLKKKPVDMMRKYLNHRS